jgi:hypothetical protein
VLDVQDVSVVRVQVGEVPQGLGRVHRLQLPTVRGRGGIGLLPSLCRSLFILATLLSLALCVAVAVLWVRSY